MKQWGKTVLDQHHSGEGNKLYSIDLFLYFIFVVVNGQNKDECGILAG